MIIRRAGVDDLEAIAAIQGSSPEASQWKVAEYLEYECFVCPLPDGRGSVGFIVARMVAAGEGEILNLAVAPEARRAGVGQALLRHVLKGTPGSWFLEVRESNAGAIRLYETTGFRRFGERSGYYANSTEKAIVMHFQS